MSARWLALLPLALVGCVPTLQPFHRPDPPSPIEAGLNPVELIDPQAQADAGCFLALGDLYALGEAVRQTRKPAVMPKKRTVLALSGGGSFGAYTAGVLCGWTEAGTRPQFDVVTGVSTGALIAPLAFLGPKYDPELKRLYTTVTDCDIYRLRDPVSALTSDSVADTTPMAEEIARIVTPEFLALVAAEHAKGRRLYAGTTALDTGRPVVWDLGAIAARGTPESLTLFREVLRASAAVPGLFPPVRLPVEVDGKRLDERHIDGGVTAAVFFRPPHVPADKQGDPEYSCLYGSDLYVIVAGKLYPDPDRVRGKALAVAGHGVATLISAQTRGDLIKLYAGSLLTGMNFRLAAIPAAFPAPTNGASFDPEEMGRMFAEGAQLAKAGAAWRATPPGVEPGEGVFQRAGGPLTRVPLTTAGQSP